MSKKVLLIFSLCAMILIFHYYEMKYSDKQLTKSVKEESINYKITDKNGESVVLINTTNNSVTINLSIKPSINISRKVKYSIFMNGKQMNCLWNGNNKKVFEYLVMPDREDIIEIKIENIPEGSNTFHMGTIYYPDKTKWDDEFKLLTQETMLGLKSFTVNVGDKIDCLDFDSKSELLNPNNSLVTTSSGDISSSDSSISLVTENKLSSQDILYYHWKNDYDKSKNVRFSILLNWNQIKWPGLNSYFVDTKVEPGDVVSWEIDISDFENKGDQLCVVAFINPGKSFWYYDPNDKSNPIKANKDGALGFSTYRTILIQ